MCIMQGGEKQKSMVFSDWWINPLSCLQSVRICSLVMGLEYAFIALRVTCGVVSLLQWSIHADTKFSSKNYWIFFLLQVSSIVFSAHSA
jgi:hypothetical protein